MYKVTKRYGRGPESIVGTYKTLVEATTIVQESLANDATLRVNALYSVYEGMDLLEEFDQSKLVASSESHETSSSGSPGSGQRFSPSPYSTKPQPGGMPRSSWQDNSSSDKDKK